MQHVLIKATLRELFIEACVERVHVVCVYVGTTVSELHVCTYGAWVGGWWWCVNKRVCVCV